MRWYLALIFFLFLSLSFSWPLLLSGHLDNDDGIWAMVRQAEMHREMRDLQFPPRWAGYLNHGYGYPLFLFAYPLPYLVGEIFLLLGFGVISTVKILFFLSIFLSLVAMYIFSHKLWGTNGALISTILYTYAPYRLTNLYQRGNMGELWAFAFFPVLLYLYQLLIEKPTRIKILFASLLTSLFLLNHNASVVLFAPVLGFWLAAVLYIHKFTLNRIMAVSLSGVFGLALSAWFWLPAIIEKKFISLSINPLTYKEYYFLDWSNLILGRIQDTTSLILSLGGVHVFIGIIITAIFLIQKHSSKIALFFISIALIYIWMTTAFSESFWKLPLFSEIDFPWRSLGVVMFSISIAGGYLGKLKQLKWLPIVLLASLLVMEFPRILNSRRIDRIDEYYETNDATTTSADELMPIWVTDKATNRQGSIFYAPTVIDGLVSYEKSNHVEFQITSSSIQNVILNKVYFPGWTLYSDGLQINVSPSTSMGLLSFKTIPGTHIYNLRFEKTPIRIFADLISCGGTISLGLLWIVSKKAQLYS